MPSRLVNVRLDQDRLRKARLLRKSGVALSDVVREAIDARFEALARPMTAREVAAAMAGIRDRYPDAADLPARSYSVHDFRDARAAAVRRLERRPR